MADRCLRATAALLGLLVLPGVPRAGGAAAGSVKKVDNGSVYTLPPAPLTAEQRARADSKRAMVERMTPAPAAAPGTPVKSGEFTTVIPGPEGAPSLKAPPAPGESLITPEAARARAGVKVGATSSSDPMPYFAESAACRAAGICKSGDRVWTGMRQWEADGIPVRSDAGRQP
jgi:hypothetical protein